MQITKNLGLKERYFRAILGVICVLAAFFWLSNLFQVLLYLFGFIFLINALTGFCLVYYSLNISTYNKSRDDYHGGSKKSFAVIVALIIIAGIFGSYIITKQKFLSDFDVINSDYKQLLISTAQENREGAIGDYNKLSQSYESFYGKYKSYRPYVIRRDREFNKDLDEIKKIIDNSRDKITYGNITSGYASLETIRSVINDIRRRNNLESDKVALTDLYTSIELLDEASNAQDQQEIEKAYLLVNEKLKYLESFKNDSQIQLMRTYLDSIDALAKKKDFEKLPSRIAELKSSYLQVYLGQG